MKQIEWLEQREAKWCDFLSLWCSEVDICTSKTGTMWHQPNLQALCWFVRYLSYCWQYFQVHRVLQRDIEFVRHKKLRLQHGNKIKHWYWTWLCRWRFKDKISVLMGEIRWGKQHWWSYIIIIICMIITLAFLLTDTLALPHVRAWFVTKQERLCRRMLETCTTCTVGSLPSLTPQQSLSLTHTYQLTHWSKSWIH